MRIFGLDLGGDDDDEEAREAAQRTREQDVVRVEAGGIPLAAEARIRELAGRSDGFFTSGLSVADFGLTRERGLRPICQVMGSSVYKVGWQNFPWSGWGQDGQVVELRQLTDAWNDARRLALGRLEQEAALAGADAVIDVSFERRDHEFLTDEVEVIVNGTAVRGALSDRAPTAGAPRLSDLSAPDFALLHRGGYDPVGVVAATSVFYVAAGRMTRRLTTGWQRGTANQELTDFTQGVYAARETAMGRANQQAVALGAEGIVGADLSVHVEVREWEDSGDNRHEDLIVTAHLLGTAIVARGVHQSLDPDVVVRQGAPTR